MEAAVNNGICRCCASDGTCKDVKSTYHWMGEEEIYSDMLRDCFDISLIQSEYDDGGICEVCITQLRNASNFKKQVLHTEKQFELRIQGKLFKSDIVKIEPSKVDNEANDSDNYLSEEFSCGGEDFEVPIKIETDDVKPKKRAAAAKASTSRAKKAKANDGETSTKRMDAEVWVEIEKMPTVLIGKEITVRKVNPAKSKDAKTFKSNTGQVQIVSGSSKEKLGIESAKGGQANQNVIEVKRIKKDKTQGNPGKTKMFEKHMSNMTLILRCSNATPIRIHNELGFMCGFCDEQYKDPADLKRHTLDKHENENVRTSHVLGNKCMYNLVVKLDITDLRCKICNEDIDTLEQLIEHLVNKHATYIFTDIKNQIIPLKFDGEEFRCFICKNAFNKLKPLVEHMTSHYKNYVCDVCEAGFFSKINLASHSETHKIGTFKCEQCPKVFNTAQKKKSHIKSVHSLLKNHRCRLCNETFKHDHVKQKHLEEVHGVANTGTKCQACNKVFSDIRGLRSHVRNLHLMEKNHKCTECEKCFFSLAQLKNHIVSHTGARDFQCGVCTKAFGRKKTLTEHMRIHEDDRRFKCEYCKHTFVQKCSWRSHLRSIHGEIV